MRLLKLLSIDKPLEGGSTKPLLITAQDERGVVKQYVMKCFRKERVGNNYSVAKEVFINELARDFELPVAECAVILIEDVVCKNSKGEVWYEYYVFDKMYDGSKYLPAVVSKEISVNGKTPPNGKNVNPGCLKFLK